MKHLSLYVIFIAIPCVLFFSGCDENKPETKNIAILKFATHPALDDLETGFVERLDSLTKTIDSLQNVTIIKFNANGNPQSAKSIAESFNYKNINTILTIGTPSAVAVSKTQSNIPYLYGAVANPQGVGIIPSNRATGIQSAGESIIVKALSFIKAAFPNIKKIGTLYNPSDPASVFVQNLIKKHCEEIGIEYTQIQVNNSSQLAGPTEYLCDKVDVIYTAIDNTVNAGISSVVSVCDKKNKPIIIGDLSTLSKGPLFAVGLEYKAMGRQLADIMFEILKGKSIEEFPPQNPPDPEIWLNKTVMKKLNYVFPSDSNAIKAIDKMVE